MHGQRQHRRLDDDAVKGQACAIQMRRYEVPPSLYSAGGRHHGCLVRSIDPKQQIQQLMILMFLPRQLVSRILCMLHPAQQASKNVKTDYYEKSGNLLHCRRFQKGIVRK